MNIIKDFFIKLGSEYVKISKDIIFGFKRGLKIHLDVIIEIFNIVKGRYLTK